MKYRHPALMLLFAVALVLVNAPATRDNIGRWLSWPATQLFGDHEGLRQLAGTLVGALKLTGFYVFNVAGLYLFSAVILRERTAA